MATSKISRLTVQRLPYVQSNFADSNTLGKALMTRPDVLYPTITKIFSSRQYYADTPFYSQLVNPKRMVYVDNREFEWKIMGADTRPLVVVEKVETSTKPGFGNSVFRIVLDEDWYLPGDVITPGTTNKKFQCRIQSGPQKHGTGWLYYITPITSDPTVYVPTQYLEPGTRWTKMFSVYGEASDQAGSTQTAMPMSLRATLGRLKKQYGLTGDVKNTVLAITLIDDKGRKYNTWMDWIEVQFWQQWYREVERYLWYGRVSNEKVLDSNGRPVNTSPGIQQQLEDSNIAYYSVLSPKLLEEYMMDIYYSRIRPGSRKTISVYTGEAGMLEFHKAMQELIAKNQWYIANSNFAPVSKRKSEYHANAYAVGWQFIEYMMPNGVSVKVVHNPIYDDQTIHLEKHPLTGRPLESYRFTFLDFEGDDSLDSNIKLVRKKGGFKVGYLRGLAGAQGEGRTDIAHKADYDELIIQDEFGAVIKDVTKCGELILDIN